MDRAKLEMLLEAYGDDPLPILQNALLGVLRKRKALKKMKPDERRAAIEASVSQWLAAFAAAKPAIVDWLVKKA